MEEMISVVVVTYNQEKTIARTLDSILCQRCHLPIEIVIGEDASTDNTRAICEDYAKRYPHAIPVQAPAKGQLLWQVDVNDDSAAPIAGTEVKAGMGMGFVQTYYGMEELIPAVDGRVVATLGKQGDKVEKGEIVAFIEGAADSATK